MFVLVLPVYKAAGRIRVGKVVLNALFILLAGALAGGAATGVMWLAAESAGVPFSLTSLKYLTWDWIPVLVLLAVMAAAYTAFFISRSRKSDNFVFEHLLGLILLMLVISAVLLVAVGENFFLMFPAACAMAALLLHVIMYMNIMSLPALLLAELAWVPFLYNLYTAMTAGSIGIVMFLAFLYTVMTVSLMRCFMKQRR